MRSALQYLSWALGLGLNILLLRELIRGLYRRIPFLFAYSVALVLSTVVEIGAFSNPALEERARLYYWIDDAIRQSLLFCLVISLIYQSMANAEKRRAVRRWLILGAVLISAISFAAHRNPRVLVSQWMTAVSRDLSFCSAVLDVMLWLLLVASRKKNRLLLMLSGGLGVQFAGQAAGQSLRYLSALTRSYSLMWAGNICLLAANLFCLFVWWRASHRAGIETLAVSNARPVKALPRDS